MSYHERIFPNVCAHGLTDFLRKVINIVIISFVLKKWLCLRVFCLTARLYLFTLWSYRHGVSVASCRAVALIIKFVVDPYEHIPVISSNEGPRKSIRARPTLIVIALRCKLRLNPLLPKRTYRKLL